jgi:hypothetical protein
MATILDEWPLGDLLIAVLRVCGIVVLIGGIVLIFSAFSAARRTVSTRRDSTSTSSIRASYYALAGTRSRPASGASDAKSRRDRRKAGKMPAFAEPKPSIIE